MYYPRLLNLRSAVFLTIIIATLFSIKAEAFGLTNSVTLSFWDQVNSVVSLSSISFFSLFNLPPESISMLVIGTGMIGIAGRLRKRSKIQK